MADSDSSMSAARQPFLDWRQPCEEDILSVLPDRSSRCFRVVTRSIDGQALSFKWADRLPALSAKIRRPMSTAAP